MIFLIYRQRGLDYRKDFILDSPAIFSVFSLSFLIMVNLKYKKELLGFLLEYFKSFLFLKVHTVLLSN